METIQVEGFRTCYDMSHGWMFLATALMLCQILGIEYRYEMIWIWEIYEICWSISPIDCPYIGFSYCTSMVNPANLWVLPWSLSQFPGPQFQGIAISPTKSLGRWAAAAKRLPLESLMVNCWKMRIRHHKTAQNIIIWKVKTCVFLGSVYDLRVSNSTGDFEEVQHLSLMSFWWKLVILKWHFTRNACGQGDQFG